MHLALDNTHTHLLLSSRQTVRVIMTGDDGENAFKNTQRQHDERKMLRKMLREHALVNAAPIKPAMIDAVKW